MKVLLLAGEKKEHKGNHPALFTVEEQLYIDWQIHKLYKMNFEVVVIIGGSSSEEVLRRSHRVSECELVYDTNETDDSTWMTNIRSGLHAVNRECFALPLEMPCPDIGIWNKINAHSYRWGFDRGAHIIRPFCPIQGELVPGFPVMITRLGRQFLQHNEDIESIDNEKLIMSPTAVLDTQISARRNDNLTIFSENSTN